MKDKKTKSITLVKIKVATETRSMTVLNQTLTKNSRSRWTGSRCTDQQEERSRWLSNSKEKITNGGFENSPSSKTKSQKQVDRAPVGNHRYGKNEVGDFRTSKKAVVNSSGCTSRNNTKLVSTANSAKFQALEGRFQRHPRAQRS